MTQTARDLFVVGLRDAHAVEHQAQALLDRQIDRLESYPELRARMRQHRTETDAQVSRLEQILDSLGESHSMIKDIALAAAGNLAALGHAFAGDEVLKNSFASFAFENFEAASYKSLIAMGEAAGMSDAVRPLQQTLDEELSMAAWLDDHMADVTRKFLSLKTAGLQASH